MKNKTIKITLTFAILVSIFGCASLKPKTDLQKGNISGQVKSIQYALYEYGEGVGSTRTFSVEHYNRQGYVMTREMHQLDGAIDYYKYKYDSKNDVIEQREFNTDKILVATTTYTHTYNEKGDKVEINEFDESGQLGSKIIFALKKEKNIQTIGTKIFRKDGSLDYRIVEKYDTKQKQLLEVSVYEIEGNPDYKTVYKNDDRGNAIEMITYDMTGEIKNKATNVHLFDEHQNWIKKTYYEHGKATSVEEREIQYYK